MALFQIRKGSTANKGTLAAGELYDNTQLGTLQMGVDGVSEVTLLTSASIVNAISASLEETILNVSSSLSTSIGLAITNLTGNSASFFTTINNLSSSVYSTDSNEITNITINSQSAWGAFQSASAYSSSFSSSLSIVSKSVYDLSSSLAGNSTLSSSIYQTDVTQSNNITTTSASAWGAFQSASAYSSSIYQNTNDIQTLTSKTGSYATTGSNTFIGTQIINGAISASGNISASNLWIAGTITTYELHTTYESSSVIYSSGSQTFGDNQNDKVSITGSLEVTGSTNFTELTGSLVAYSTSVDGRININSASAWGAFQSASSYSASLAASITGSNVNITTISASAWGAFQSASSYSSSFYTTINNTTQSVLINSQSAWGAFQSASSYSASVSTSLSLVSASLNTSILNASQSVSTSLSLVSESLNTFSSSYKNDSSSFDSRIDNLILGAGAQVGGDNEFTGQNSFSKYITGSISGAVDGIDVRALSASLNSRVIAATNEQFLGAFATTSSVEIISSSVWGAFQSASSYSASIYTRDANQDTKITEASASAWGAFQSASAYSASVKLVTDTLAVSASVATSISGSNSNITAVSASLYLVSSSLYSYAITYSTDWSNIRTISASAWGAFQSASAYSASLSASNASTFITLSQNITNLSASLWFTDTTQSVNITTASASAWGAFQSASTYSASAATTYALLSGSNQFNGDQIISGSLIVTGDVTAYYSSDERLKDNIKLISNPIEKVQQLRGVEFDWNDKSMFKVGKHDYGVIAQDVEKVLPELVKETHTGYLGVDYDKIVSLLIEVVKEQEKRIKELENKIGS